jgi:5-methylcytosine-specific restriction endonuclease McrA
MTVSEFKIHKKKRRKQQLINQKLRKTLLSQIESASCCYCNQIFSAQELTIEHKIPLCMGGNSDIENIALACAPCNRAKGKESWMAIRKLNRERYRNANETGKN